ncbi:MAG: FAD-dependent oxidoreductase, partial [Desulfobacterales bacterium]|nr:FAD-dependent oxidoreductase [Desulfobacterales bacterium]
MIQRREFLAAAMISPAVSEIAPITCDVFVYGSTPGGVAAALEAARRGLKVVLACPKTHLGGMAASGLSTTDAVRPQLFGGLVAEFVEGVRKHYTAEFASRPDELQLINSGWYYEPSVAELIFTHLVKAEEKMLRWLPGHHLVSAKMNGRKVDSVELESPAREKLWITARTFIDGTYEGDLAAAAKVPYRVGREAKAEHGEPFAGIHYMNWRTGQQIMTPDTGESSPAIQAFCARSIFTDDPSRFVRIEKPASFEDHLPDYLPLLGDFASG